jgi:hypothetical protein
LKRQARLLENTFLDPILRDALVIDTPLWQHAEYQSFFDALSIILKRIGKKYILFDEQYNELIQGSLQKDSATTDTRTSSAHTQSILDQIKEQGLIAFEPPQVSLDDSMFEQPPIIRVLAGAAQKTHNVTFVSESRGLIAQARNYLIKKKIGITIIDDLESLLPQCDTYCNAVKEGIVIPLPRYKG